MPLLADEPFPQGLLQRHRMEEREGGKGRGKRAAGPERYARKLA
jgi:hypothetical protein